MGGIHSGSWALHQSDSVRKVETTPVLLTERIEYGDWLNRCWRADDRKGHGDNTEVATSGSCRDPPGLGMKGRVVSPTGGSEWSPAELEPRSRRIAARQALVDLGVPGGQLLECGGNWKLTATAKPRNCCSVTEGTVSETESSTFLLPLPGSLWRPSRNQLARKSAIQRATALCHRPSPERRVRAETTA